MLKYLNSESISRCSGSNVVQTMQDAHRYVQRWGRQRWLKLKGLDPKATGHLLNYLMYISSQYLTSLSIMCNVLS